MKTGSQSQPDASTLGALVACVLAGSWRESVPPQVFSAAESAELFRVIRILVSSGAAALALKTLHECSVLDDGARGDLHNIHRYFAITNAVHEQSLTAVFKHLRSHNIEPILIKGWGIGRMYADSTRRPFGDIDICVKSESYEKAAGLIEEAAFGKSTIDLHLGFTKFYEANDDDIWARSRLVELNGCEVRVPSEEDHFRHICLHFFRHGANRPLWACDICVAIETRSDNFNWTLALGTTEPQRNWISTAAGVAAALLNCDLSSAPSDINPSRLPQWVSEVVLKEWGQLYHFPPPLSSAAGNITKLARELPKHWPNPIEATLNLNRSFGNKPRLMLQISDVAAKGIRVIAQTRGLTKAPTK